MPSLKRFFSEKLLKGGTVKVDIEKDQVKFLYTDRNARLSTK